MRDRLKGPRILVVILVVAFYVAVLIGGLTESTRRSLDLRDDTGTSDRVLISITVTGVNALAQELTAQLGFRLAGSVAKDDVTPAIDLQLLVNSVSGQQEFDFPKGKRMNRIEAVFPLNGELNNYPFDRYETTLWLLMTTPAKGAHPQVSKESENPPEIGPQIEEFAVSSSALQRRNSVPVSISAVASIPGIRFRGSVSRSNTTEELIGMPLDLSRSNSVIGISLIVMAMMTALSVSLLAMVLRSTREPGKTDLLPLSLSISLIFGLPALRNIQPGVPPVGALVDYVAFVWAELIVAVSAVIIIWTWLLRSRPES